MDLPRRYSYNPRLRLILSTVGAGAVWIVLQRLSCGRIPYGFSLWFGLLPIALGLLLAVRRAKAYRYLLLDRDELLLPTGFLQTRITRIPYISIERVSRIYLPGTAVLRLATKNGRFEIASTLLPDSESYLAVEKFLNVRARENIANQTRGSKVE